MAEFINYIMITLGEANFICKEKMLQVIKDALIF